MISAEKPLVRLARLEDRVLWGLVLAAVVLLGGYFLLFHWPAPHWPAPPRLDQAWRTPGSPRLYLTGVCGALLLLVAFGFVFAKRTGRAGPAPRWLAAHVVAALLGTVLAVVHTAGSFTRPPALLLLVLTALAVIGVWARTRASARMAAVFASRLAGFVPPQPGLRDKLAEIILRKTRLLAGLAPEAGEGTFSLRAVHWLRHPRGALAYTRLAARERRLVGAHRTLAPAHAHWRRAHILLALLFVGGLAAHIITVTFFAGYVAGGKPITWWHLTAW